MKLNAKTTSSILMMILASAGLLHCRKQVNSGSSVESLDNVAPQPGAGQTQNVCGISYDGTKPLPAAIEALRDKITAPDAASRNAVLGVLAAVPDNLRQPFFAVGGRIEVSAEAVSICSATKLSAAQQDFAGSDVAAASCWTQASPSAAPVIHIMADPAVIHHGLLRLFGYVYTEFFVPRLGQPASPAPFNGSQWQTLVTAFKSERERLATAFLEDVRSTNHDAYLTLNKFNSNEPENFANYIFAEALDSYYCSAKSRTTFQTSFKNAWAVFTDTSTPSSPVQDFGSR